MNNKANRFLAQALKNQLVEFKVRDKIAKGESRIKTFIIIYLSEYEKTKFSKEILKVPLIRPSKEKMSIELVLIDILLFIVVINSEKHTDFPNKFSPNPLSASDILEFKSNIKEIIKKEQFIAIPYKISFITKLMGDSV